MSDPQPTPDRQERDQALMGIEELLWKSINATLAALDAERADNVRLRGLVETAARIVREQVDELRYGLDHAQMEDERQWFNAALTAAAKIRDRFAAAGLLTDPQSAERVEVVEPEQIRHAQMLADSDACDQPVVVPVWESDVEW